MNWPRIFASGFVLLALLTPAHAQKTKAQLNSEIANQFPDNNVGAITPQVLRNVTNDIVNSIMPTAPVTSGNGVCLDGTTGLLKDCGGVPLYGVKTGNTNIFATSTGTLTVGDCIKIDSSGNLIDSGASCGAGANVANAQNFSAGTDFTAGSTTTLTLSSAPTNAQQLMLAFDGVVQSHNTWSLSGAVVTFNIAIPINVSVVEAQWQTSSTTAGVGSLTDSAGNAASGAVKLAPPLTVSSNTVTTGGACYVKSRATATSLNLSLCNTVITGGYAQPGDGGGATFKNVGTTAFTDTNISTWTITGGSSYTNGTYLGVAFSNGTGLGCGGQVVVSGNAVSAIAFDNPCTGYLSGDTLTMLASQVGGTGSGAAINVTGITTALGSFTDSIGTHFQIVTDANAFPNVRQFGAKLDYNGVDASATNDLASFNSGIYFVYHPYSGAAANVNGGTLLVPRGASLLCGGSFQTLFIPQGVQLRGAGTLGGTTLKQCTAQAAGSHFVSLCGIYTSRGQIGCKIADMTLIADGASNSNVAAVYSSSGQQFPLVERVWIQAGLRGCIYYEKGTGGAANAIFSDFDCEGDPASSNNRVTVAANVGSTQVKFTNAVIEASGAFSGTGIALLGGNAIIDTINFENIATAITVNNTLPTVIKNITSGPNCTTIVSLTNTNPNGVTSVENLTGGACSTTVANNHSGGSNLTGNVVLPTRFNP